MAFRIRADESVQDAVQRIAREQIDKAIDEVDDEELDRHEAVHQARKRCKKIRGLIRLVRPALEETYDIENAWYRDSARPLSCVRDAQALVETFDALTDHFENQVDREAFSEVRRQLTDRRQTAAQDEVGLRQRLAGFLDRMREGRERVAAWRLHEDGFDAVQGGLRKTYSRGRAAMSKAYENPGTESFHEWRKRTKYHWYHMRLLRLIWDGPLKERRNEADRLSDCLGDDHNLSILRETLLDRPEDFGGRETIQALAGLATQRQVELRNRAETLGARVFAERPKRFARRLRSYWNAWRIETESTADLRYAPNLVTA